jgi:hypothetical protein
MKQEFLMVVLVLLHYKGVQCLMVVLILLHHKGVQFLMVVSKTKTTMKQYTPLE